MIDAGDVLRKCREERGLSQGELSAISGYARATISGIETQARDTTMTTFNILLESLGYDLAVIDKRNE